MIYKSVPVIDMTKEISEFGDVFISGDDTFIVLTKHGIAIKALVYSASRGFTFRNAIKQKEEDLYCIEAMQCLLRESGQEAHDRIEGVLSLIRRKREGGGVYELREALTESGLLEESEKYGRKFDEILEKLGYELVNSLEPAYL